LVGKSTNGKKKVFREGTERKKYSYQARGAMKGNSLVFRPRREVGPSNSHRKKRKWSGRGVYEALGKKGIQADRKKKKKKEKAIRYSVLWGKGKPQGEPEKRKKPL